MNKVAAALDAVFAVIVLAAGDAGIASEAVHRNVARALDAVSDDTDEISAPSAAQPHYGWIEVQDGLPQLDAAYLGQPPLYDLTLSVRVLVLGLGSNEPRHRALVTALCDALASRLDNDPTVGGTTSWAELADGGEDAAGADDGAEVRAQEVMIELHVTGCTTRRG